VKDSCDQVSARIEALVNEDLIADLTDKYTEKERMVEQCEELKKKCEQQR
jgi:hypothetical protein